MGKQYVSRAIPLRCQEFFAKRGEAQPMCSDSPCWDHFFFKNPGKVALTASLLREHGKDAIILAQGKEFTAHVEQREKQEFANKQRVGFSDYVEIARNRGTLYLKMYNQFLRNYPVASLEVAA